MFHPLPLARSLVLASRNNISRSLIFLLSFWRWSAEAYLTLLRTCACEAVMPEKCRAEADDPLSGRDEKQRYYIVLRTLRSVQCSIVHPTCPEIIHNSTCGTTVLRLPRGGLASSTVYRKRMRNPTTTYLPISLLVFTTPLMSV